MPAPPCRGTDQPDSGPSRPTGANTPPVLPLGASPLHHACPSLPGHGPAGLRPPPPPLRRPLPGRSPCGPVSLLSCTGPVTRPAAALFAITTVVAPHVPCSARL